MCNPVTKKISVSKPTKHQLTAYIAAAAEHILPIIATLTSLGKHPHSKTDEFSEKFQTAFDPPHLLIFGKLCCRFFKKLYSLKNHICGIFLKSPGYESIKNNDPCCQIQSLNFKFWGWLGPRLLVH